MSRVRPPVDVQHLFLEQYHHVVLPRDIPGGEEKNLTTINSALLGRFAVAVKTVLNNASPTHRSHIESIRSALDTCRVLNFDGALGKRTIVEEFRKLAGERLLILQIAAQNAALLVYLQDPDSETSDVVFEAFETSATCEAVLAAQNALKWDFPGCAVRVRHEDFSTTSFQEHLASTLEQASTEHIPRFASITYKAAAPLREIRDTTNPALITGMLMALLEGVGSSHSVELLQKRVRDTVSFRHALKPWRRSAFYLVVRVAIQRRLYQLLGHEVGGIYYKTIICVLVNNLLNDAHSQLPDEASHNLRQKLGQRLAKLEALQSRCSTTAKKIHEYVFRGLGPTFDDTLSYVGRWLAHKWKNFRFNSERAIPHLPQQVPPEQLRLALSNSTPYLREVFLWTSKHAQTSPSSASELLAQYEASVAAAKPYIVGAKQHIALLQFEEESLLPCMQQFTSGPSDRCCMKLSSMIHEYIDKAGSTLDGYSEFKSRMLLYVMELWVAMDKHALEQYPLLQDYHPAFTVDILDTLELLDLELLTRALAVRSYIADRCSASCFGTQSIFAIPSTNSFAVRFFDQSEALQNLRVAIEDEAEEKRTAKEKEWQEKSERYAILAMEQAEVSCVFDEVVLWDGQIQEKHRWPCRWHELKKEMSAIRINLHEHPLPTFEPSAKATVFELQCPKGLCTYRDATWKILASLAYSESFSQGRMSLLQGYSELGMYANGVEKNVSLASASKSHLQCHYATTGFPVDFRDVCRACGLKPDYFDKGTSTWVYRQEKVSLMKHFLLKLPPQSPFRELDHSYGNWPSSNEILASQGRCPPEVNAHEYIAWQDLLVGKSTRWLSLLRELASTNINFSTDSTWALVSRLILELGPNTLNADALGDIHVVFRDDAFCTALLNHIQHRVKAIRRNWRESVQLDLIIAILLKTTSCASSYKIQQEAMKLLRTVRIVAARWCADLQALRNDDANMSTEPLIWAALLCKRTFHLEENRFETELVVESQFFVHASVSLQDNLRKDFRSLAFNLRAAILRDVVFAYTHRHLIHDLLSADTMCFVKDLDDIWSLPHESHSTSTLQSIADSWWLLLTLTSAEATHYVHYNYVYGTLLVDGQELRTLPLEYRTHPTYRNLFGNKTFRAFPSPLPDMSWAISEAMPMGHYVHIGMTKNRLVVKAIYQREILEFIPHEIFVRGPDCDLPLNLVYNCFHWVNHNRGHIEVRLDAWRSRPSNWFIVREAAGFFARRYLEKYSRAAVLLEPKSSVARQIAKIFHHFEHSAHMMIYQETARDNTTKIFVDLKRMEMNFYVNSFGLLQSDRLRASIAANQDAGTWHGLKSKIVIRSTLNYDKWSVLVPIGTMHCRKDRGHVSVVILNEGGLYMKFDINHLLGRIECSPDPRLLYTKALLHAITSHFIPDRLTRRTGQEEALSLLQDGSYQPWSPIDQAYLKILASIGDLAPEHKYYPPDRRVMESITWRPQYTIHMQNERYRSYVRRIFERSAHLAEFELGSARHTTPSVLSGNEHLESRALSRLYGAKRKADNVYMSRDTRIATPEYSNVLHMTTMLQNWDSYPSDVPDLISLLENSHVIGGYGRELDRFHLSGLLAIDLKANWGSLAKHAAECKSVDKYRLSFLYGPMAFGDDVDIGFIKILILLSKTAEAKIIDPPAWPAYFHFRADQTVPLSYLLELIEEAKKAFNETPYLGGRRHQRLVAENKHHMAQETACRNLAKSVQSQWPSQQLCRDSLVQVDHGLVDVNKALDAIDPEWTRLYQNHELAEYFRKVQKILDRYAAVHSGNQAAATAPFIESETRALNAQRYPNQSSHDDLPTLRQLLANTEQKPLSVAASRERPSVPLGRRSGNIMQTPANQFAVLDNETQPFKQLPQTKTVTHHAVPPHVGELTSIVQHVQQEESPVSKRFSVELDKSIKAHIANLSRPQQHVPHFDRTQLQYDIESAKRRFNDSLDHLRATLFGNDSRVRWLEHAQIWPRMTIVELLKELSSRNDVALKPLASEYLVELGVKLTNYQRLLRMEDAQRKGKIQQHDEERANPGHTNWNPAHHLDWLLLEIDGDIMLREEQITVALATIAPDSGQNAVLQLLMGKGKTSCILPMVACELANRKNLMRIVVPRALLLQSTQVMQAKLGGLVHREIMHIPFSRRTSTNIELMQLYKSLQAGILDRRGIMICLPEHILSFQLSGMQQLCDDRVEEASVMINTQDWLNKVARDVLDECDVSLAIKTQLIYPLGSQMTVDGHPHRWQTVQGLLRLVESLLPAVHYRYPQSVEMVKRAVGGYPLIYFLRKDAEDCLIHMLVEAICEGSESILPCAELSLEDRRILKVFMSSPVVSSEADRRVQKMFGDQVYLLKITYLLRGLFVHRILLSTLKKRWNVQYGLHPSRDPIAVPYSAKGVPSPTAEWGHPDVAIILTCLSTYYEGLNISQFKQAFEQLVKSDDPSVEYDRWTASGVPFGFADYTAINMEDSWQLNELHGYIRHNVYLLDFYLNNLVFPRYAKQFKTKLQASGWDLVLFDSSRKTESRTTGFSGTNDSRHQLPMTIAQADLPELAHTNAEVLSYLLLPRNREYVLAVDAHGKRLGEVDLLQELHNPRLKAKHYYSTGSIKILVDAGAQILEHDNQSLAKEWLEIDTDAPACVYFAQDHRAWVLYRTGRNTPLLASPFAENMEKCLVYIDESHCRGTDLKLPPYARAALTLGQHLTKDALTQAAMRLRLLGQSQSVTFYSPPEVHQSIIDLRLKRNQTEGGMLDSSDVMFWLLVQTCRTIEQLEPLHITQGVNYLRQRQAKIDHPEFLVNEEARANFMSIMRVSELQGLKQLYAPKLVRRANDAPVPSFKGPLKKFASELNRRKATFHDRGTAVHASALEEVEIEVEREIEVEVESVREIQRPIVLRALKYGGLHPDIVRFAINGRILPGADAYQPMFSTLQKTALGKKHGLFAALKTNLFISAEFSRTVDVVEPHDHYARAGQWVVWSTLTEKALLVSHEEADDLVPILRSEQLGYTHLIVYSAPVTRRTLHFNDINFYAIPSLPEGFQAPNWLKIELGIFSGKLYFDWDEYYDLLGYLGEHPDSFAPDNSQSAACQPFAKKPLSFLHEWLALRRKGQDFEHTPMGYITTGKRLSEEHSFFSKYSADQDNDLHRGIAIATRPQQEDDHEHEVEDEGEDEHVAHVPEDGHEAGDDHFLEAESEDEFEDAHEYTSSAADDGLSE